MLKVKNKFTRRVGGYVLLLGFLCLQTGCSKTQDVSNSPVYAAGVGLLYRTKMDFVVYAKSSDVEFAPYALQLVDQVLPDGYTRDHLPPMYGKDKVLGLLREGSLIQVIRFIEASSIDVEYVYPIVQVLSEGPFKGLQIDAACLADPKYSKILDGSSAELIPKK